MHFKGGEHPEAEIGRVGQVVLLLFLVWAEPTQFVTPLRPDLFTGTGNTKETFDRFHDRQEGIGATGKQVESDHSFIGPRMEGDVTFQKNSNT
jgi:hypothetical protein